MYRRAFITLLAATLALPAAAVADTGTGPLSVAMTAGQIEDLLRGNTIEGTWSGAGYSQFFAATGSTIYIPQDGQPSHGKWRVNPETNAYESWWEQTGWTPYSIVMTNDGFAWVHGKMLEPFRVSRGR